MCDSALYATTKTATRKREATSRLLAGGDPAAVTLRGVAREAGVAAPSVYGHFEDLDALLLAVVEQHLSQLRAAVEAAAGDDPADRLRAACLAYAGWGVEHPGAYAVVFGGRAVRLLSAQESAAFADGEAMLAHLRDLVAALPPGPGEGPGHASGPEDAAGPSVEQTAMAVWTGLHGCVGLRTGKPGYPWPPLAEHVDLVLATLLGPRS